MPCSVVAALGRDVDGRAGLGQLDRHPHEADVLLEAGGPHRVGDVADLLAVANDVPDAGELGAELVAVQLDADELAVDAARP